MKRSVLLSFFLFLVSINMTAQLGLSVAPTQGFAKDWQVMVENYISGKRLDFLKHGNTSTIDYTFQLNSPAWQIQPAIHAMRSNMIYKNHDFEVYTIGLIGNINFAPFVNSFEELIDKKAIIYFQFSPGIGFVQQKYVEYLPLDGAPNNRSTLSDRKLAINIGLNALLELRLSQLLTLSPYAGVRYFPNLVWEGFSSTISDGKFDNEYDTINWRHYTLGLRIGINLNRS